MKVTNAIWLVLVILPSLPVIYFAESAPRLQSQAFAPANLDITVEPWKIQVAPFQPIVYRSSDPPSTHSRHVDLTFSPPKGHGLIATIQALSYRTNSRVCRFGFDGFPFCLRCLDYIDFSTPTQMTTPICGDVEVCAGASKGSSSSLPFLGQASFIGAVGEDILITVHQESAAGLEIGPYFAVALTPYKTDCNQGHSNRSLRMRRCPHTANSNGVEESYWIYKGLFCDRIANCPLAGPQSIGYGWESDESNCNYTEREEEWKEMGARDQGTREEKDGSNTRPDDKKARAKVTVMSLDEFIRTSFPKHVILRFPTDNKNELHQLTGQDNNKNCCDADDDDKVGKEQQSFFVSHSSFLPFGCLLAVGLVWFLLWGSCRFIRPSPHFPHARDAKRTNTNRTVCISPPAFPPPYVEYAFERLAPRGPGKRNKETGNGYILGKDDKGTLL